jgi:dTDP-4-dehydrorhamnose reductase
VKTVLRLGAERDHLAVVDDQQGCPTAAREVAKACLTLALNLRSGPDGARYGTFHFAGAGEATWCELARAVVSLAGSRTGRQPTVAPITTAEYPTAALRPADTRLDCSAIARVWDIRPRPWRDALAETLERILEGNETG